MAHGNFENCYNKCNVSSSVESAYQGAGGIVGGSGGNLNIINCYNEGSISYTGSLTMTTGAGGIIGEFRGGGTLNVSNCYNIGRITSYHVAGGILGGDWAEGTKIISNCVNNGEIIAPDKNGYDIAPKFGGGIIIFNHDYYLQQSNSGLNISDATAFQKEEANDVIEELNKYIIQNGDTAENWKSWTINEEGYPILLND